MMKVVIGDEFISFGEDTLSYYPYYFGIHNHEADHRLAVKSVLRQWASAIASLRDPEQEVYLPYSLDDESCRALRARMFEGNVVLTDVVVSENGYSIDLDDLSSFMHSKPDVYEAEEVFGIYPAGEFMSGLVDAELAAA